jgi:hypothetical protein
MPGSKAPGRSAEAAHHSGMIASHPQRRPGATGGPRRPSSGRCTVQQVGQELLVLAPNLGEASPVLAEVHRQPPD